MLGSRPRRLAKKSFASSRKDAYASHPESFAFDDVEAKAMGLEQPMLVIIGAQDVFTTENGA